MARPKRTHRKKAGSAPGTVVFVGDQKTEKSSTSALQYGPDLLLEGDVTAGTLSVSRQEMKNVAWLDVVGVHDTGLLESIGNHFSIHPLTLEDIANTGQRPKVEEFETYLYMVLKMMDYDVVERKIQSEQVSLVLGPDFLITFQEKPGDVFEPVRERIRRGKGKIRGRGADYLAYALLDTIVDHYYTILERIGDDIETLEEELIANESNKTTLNDVHRLRREVLFLRREIWPLREMVSKLGKGDFELIQPSTHLFLTDVHDHVIQILDTIESYRDMLASLLDLYLSTISNRMNEVMKVLTMIATIFIPITFVAGLYGMNFEHMPELHWRWGYLGVWGIFVFIAVAMVLYFKKKRWI